MKTASLSREEEAWEFFRVSEFGVWVVVVNQAKRHVTTEIPPWASQLPARGHIGFVTAKNGPDGGLIIEIGLPIKSVTGN